LLISYFFKLQLRSKTLTAALCSMVIFTSSEGCGSVECLVTLSWYQPGDYNNRTTTRL